MATTRTWVGTDAGNEGKWNTAANWNPSGVPISTDTCIFAGTSQSVTSGLDQTGVLLADLLIRETYTGSIGAQGSPLIISASNVILKGSGEEYWIEPSTVLVAVIALRRGNANACHWGGASGGTTEIYITGGYVTIESGTVLDKLHVAADPFGFGMLPYVVIEDGVDVTTQPDVYVMLDDGVIEMNADTDGASEVHFMQNGGRLIINNNAENVWLSGGVVDHRAGNISLMYARGGFYDAGASETPRTITKFYATNNANVNLRTDVGALTVSSLVALGSPNVRNEEV